MVKRLRRAATAWAAALLAGCAVGPDFVRPDAPAPVSFTREPVAATAGGTPVSDVVSVEWWRSYGSPRIDALVERALEHNRDLAAGLANLKQAQALVAAQQGLFFPQLSAGYSATRQNSGRTLASPLASNQALFNLNTAQLNVGFVLDVFGGNRRQVESLQAQADSQRYQVAALRLTVASNVVAAAIAEQSLLEQIDAATAAVAAAREQLQQAQLMQAAGYFSAVDVAQQQLAYTESAAAVPQLRKQLEQIRDLLAVLCGELPSTDLQLPPPNALTVPQALPQTLPSQLVEQRPDVQAALEQVRAANAQVGVATAAMLPQLSLAGSLSYAADGFGALTTAANRAWAAAAGAGMPLFEGGSGLARRRAAQAGTEAALAQYHGVVLTAFQNVADTLYALDADRQAWELAREGEQAARRQFELTQQQLTVGYASRPQMLAARQAWLTARSNAAAAQAVYLGDTVALYQALGGGWQRQATAVR